MSEASTNIAGILLITVPAIAFGGARLLSFIWRRTPGYLDNPMSFSSLATRPVS
jgi:hypothetical protein